MRTLIAKLAAILFVSILAQTTAPAHVRSAERVDALGDPLPPGAIARLGTSRLKHFNMIYDATFSADGKSIASVVLDRYFGLWDAETGRREFLIDIGGAFTVDFSPAGDELLITTRAGVRIIDRQTQRNKLVLFPSGRGSLRIARFAPDGNSFALVSREGPLELWQWADGEAVRLWRVDGAFLGAKFSHDGTWLLVWDKTTLHRVSTMDGTSLATVAAHEIEIEDADISPDDEQIASAGEDGALIVWNAKTLDKLWRVEHPHRWSVFSYVHCARFSPDGATLVTTGIDRMVRFWDVATHKQTSVWDDVGHQQQLRWSPDGSRLAFFWGNGNAIRLRNVKTSEWQPDLPGHDDQVQQIDFYNGGRGLVTLAGNSDSVCIWNPQTGEQLRRFRHPGIHGMALIGDGPRIAAGGSKLLTVIDLDTGEVRLLAVCEEPTKTLMFPQVSADGKRMVVRRASSRSIVRDGKQTFDSDPRYETWDLTTPSGGTRIASYPLNARAVLSPRGDGLVGSEATTLKVWDFEDLSRERQLWQCDVNDRGDGGLEVFTLSPHGELVAIAVRKGGIKVIETASGKVIHAWDDSDYLRDLQFSPSGQHLFAGPYPWRIWDLKSGARVRTIKPRDDVPTDAAAMSGDGKFLAIGNREGEVSLWDVASGEKLVTWLGHEGIVRTLKFSPDDQSLASASDDSTVLLWSLDRATWPKKLPPALRTMESLWKLSGERDAVISYDAVREMLDRKDESLKFIAAQIDGEVALPKTVALTAENDLRVYRAAYVLEQIGGDKSKEVRARISRPLPVWDDAAREAAAKISATLDETAKADKYATFAPVAAADGSVAVRRYGYLNRLCDPKSGEPGTALPCAGTPHVITRDGRFVLLTIGHTEGFSLCEVATTGEVWRIAPQIENSTLKLHSDGRRIIAADGRRNRMTFDLLTGDKLGVWDRVEWDDTRARSPDGALYLVGDRHSGKLVVYDSKGSKKLWDIAHRPTIGVGDFITNHLIAIAGGAANTIRVHRARNGELLRTIKLADSELTLYNVAPHMQLVAAKDTDGRMHVFELATQQRVFTLNEPNVVKVRFLPGNKLLTLDGEHAVRQWDLSQLAAPRKVDESVQAMLGRLWPELRGDDGANAFAAALAFAQAGDEAVPFLRARLIIDATQHDAEIEKLIAQLDDDSFELREEASRRLLSFGSRAAVLLRASPLLKSSAEVKTRAAAIEKELSSGASPQQNRIAFVLEEIGSPAARALRDELSVAP